MLYMVYLPLIVLKNTILRKYWNCKIFWQKKKNILALKFIEIQMFWKYPYVISDILYAKQQNMMPSKYAENAESLKYFLFGIEADYIQAMPHSLSIKLHMI